MRPKLVGILTAAFFLSLASGPLTALLRAATVSATYMTTADVALRSGPGMNYATITTLPKGIKINVVGRQRYWLKVESKHGRVPGYIDEQFAEPESNTQTATARGAPETVTGVYRTLVDVDLRQGPGANYPVLAKLPSGIKVHVVSAEGEWLRIESSRGAEPGYLEKRFVERWTEN